MIDQAMTEDQQNSQENIIDENEKTKDTKVAAKKDSTPEQAQLKKLQNLHKKGVKTEQQKLA